MSTQRKIYVDANATAAPLPEVVEAVASAMRSGLGNPASAHRAGGEARRAVEKAREQVGRLIDGAFSEDVAFVSGGTEANNTVLRHFDERIAAVFFAARCEHASISRPLKRADQDGRVIWLDVDSSGRIDAEGIRRRARAAPRAQTYVLAIQAANSETGVIQPVEEIVTEFRSAYDSAFILLDAAQAVGRVRLELNKLRADAISFSGHKLHGPQGTGALILANSEAVVSPLLYGGGQERGLRSGTQNVPGIIGFGVAAERRTEEFLAASVTLRAIRDEFEGRLRQHLGNRVTFNGAVAPRVPNTSNVRFADVDGMQLLALLDARGVMASQGSACSSGRPEPSSTLTAMGLSTKEAFSSLRFSFSILNKIEEAVEAADIAAELAKAIAR
ncbi:cysteine desulfurase family protein [Methylobacterium nodulans]|uniref:Cysteine desulfurase n=1 Tax=Methylobacterium nodulans (strain LMG 21967 / CNCM I-2342 / ORS 2060) TaxID=460265 RepID=B8IDV5_METNO|nr:cysteine desulfurase family protein [Methylobacterium nodulans]ACL55677.1 aminotransferase class V [Methylobacterium nodulans ORS 2060]